MFPVFFNRDRAKHILECIRDGSPVGPASDKGWTVADMLTLAGVCHAAIISHGPADYAIRYDNDPRRIEDALNMLHQEHRELVAVQLEADVSAAASIVCDLVRMIQSNVFDELFEPDVNATVTGPTDGKREILHIEGYKRHSATSSDEQ